MKILRSTDKVSVKIGDVALIMSPMKQSQKHEITKLTKVVDGKEVVDAQAMVSAIVKYCVKGFEGVTDYNDEPIKLDFNADGSLTDESHADAMAIITSLNKHYEAMFAVSRNELPSTMVTDYATGEKIEGAEVHVLPKS